MKVFISGGNKCGKSMFAQRLSKSMTSPDAPLYYLATMIPADDEDKARVSRHQKERAGWGFETVEACRDILTVVDRCDTRGVFLLDSVTALLSNEMFMPDGHIDASAFRRVTEDLSEFLTKVAKAVVVSDFIYSDAYHYDQFTEMYRRALAYIDKHIAKHCSIVIEACCGVIITHKGSNFLKDHQHVFD